MNDSGDKRLRRARDGSEVERQPLEPVRLPHRGHVVIVLLQVLAHLEQKDLRVLGVRVRVRVKMKVKVRVRVRVRVRVSVRGRVTIATSFCASSSGGPGCSRLPPPPRAR